MTDRPSGRRARSATGAGSRADGETGHAPITSAWEHVVAAAGALVVLGAAAVMVQEALTKPDNAVPRITVEADTVVRQGESFMVLVLVRNDGQATAAALRVEGLLHGDSGVVETRDFTLDFVPARSRRAASLIFSRDPGAHRLELRPVGHVLP